LEKLIQFLMSNFYFVIIVIGLVYSLFFRKSPLERKPPNRMPDFGGGGQLPRPQRPPGQAEQPMSRPQQPRPRPAEPAAAKQLARPAAIQPSDDYRSELMAQAIAGEPDAISRSADGADGGRSSGERPADLSGDDLTKAVMWAEILGPPRARRPHGR